MTGYRRARGSQLHIRPVFRQDPPAGSRMRRSRGAGSIIRHLLIPGNGDRVGMHPLFALQSFLATPFPDPPRRLPPLQMMFHPLENALFLDEQLGECAMRICVVSPGTDKQAHTEVPLAYNREPPSPAISPTQQRSLPATATTYTCIRTSPSIPPRCPPTPSQK